MSKLRIIFSGGGTGGGTYPAIAVAQAVQHKYPHAQILWIGSASGIERNLVEKAGIRFVGVPGGPIVGKSKLKQVLSLLKLGIGTLLALIRFLTFRPHTMLMTGGWPVLPATLASVILRVPFAVLLPDIEPGTTIKRLARYAAVILTTTPQSAAYFKHQDIVEVGYPLRPELLYAAGYSPLGEQDAPGQQQHEPFDLDETAPTVLIFGGSKGTRSLNKATMDALAALTAMANVIHISGTSDWDYVQQRAIQRVMADMSGEIDPDEQKRFGRDTIDLEAATTQRYYPYEYLHTSDMARALTAADLVVSRAGASILGEFPLFELPAILVPYPYTWQYQKVNADFLVEQGAAIRINDDQLDERLLVTVTELLADSDRLQEMSRQMGRFKRPNSAERAADALVKIATGNT